jgi:hypothetical protein
LVWYSALFVTEGDNIKIYAGIQNNSGIDFTGTATFYIDYKEMSNSPFASSDNSLNDVSILWVAGPPGLHDIQVKIVTSLPPDKSLVSYESDKSSISIAKKIVPEVVKNTVTNTVTNTISNIISKINEVTVPLVNKITGAVLGVSAGIASSSERNNSSKMNSVLNVAIDGLAFLVKNWLWTLGGTILILLIIRFKRRRGK